VTKANELSYSDLAREASGKIIRRFQSGIGWILDNTVAEVIPIWVDNSGMRTKIIIGESTSSPKGLSREEVIEFWENAILSLKTS